MNRKTGIVVAFAVGAVAGAVAGVLLAPDKGENTRRKIKDNAGRMVRDTTDLVGGKAEELKTSLRTQGRAVKEAVHTARETYRHELDKAHEETPVEVHS